MVYLLSVLMPIILIIGGMVGTPVHAVTIQQTGAATSNTTSISQSSIVQSVSTATGQTTVTTGTTVTPFTGVTTPILTSNGGTFNPFGFVGTTAPVIPLGGSVFNPFPFAGAATPLTTTVTTVVNPSSAGVVNAATGTTTSVFNPFQFAGATLPLSSIGGTVGSLSVPFSPDTGVSLRPAAGGGQSVITTTSGTTTSTGGPSVQSVVTGGSSPTSQLTVSASLLAPQSSTVGTIASSRMSLGGISDPPGQRLVQNPEPSTAWLLGSGLVGLLPTMRRRLRSIDDVGRRLSE